MVLGFLLILQSLMVMKPYGAKHSGGKSEVELTPSTLPAFIKKYRCVVVKFYTPTCGACLQLKPHYTSLAQKIHAGKENIVVAAINIATYPKVGWKHGIGGIPTIKIFRKNNGKVYPTPKAMAWLAQQANAEATKRQRRK